MFTWEVTKMAKTMPVTIAFTGGPEKEKMFYPFVLNLKKNKINLTVFKRN